jgi:hypothetical protein
VEAAKRGSPLCAAILFLAVLGCAEEAKPPGVCLMWLSQSSSAKQQKDALHAVRDLLLSASTPLRN